MKFDAKKFEATPVEEENQTKFYRVPGLPAHPARKPPAEALQIKATTGLGKTCAVIEAIAGHHIWCQSEVHFYVPDYGHAAEVARIASNSGLRTKVVSGRTGNSNSPGYCARFKVADKAAKLGLSVYRTCCHQTVGDNDTRCEHFEKCPYLRQWADDKPAFRIFVHQYVFLPKPKRDGVGLPAPKLAVVDESVVLKSVKEHSFAVARLEGPFADAVERHLSEGIELGTSLQEAGVRRVLALEHWEQCQASGQSEINPTTDDKTALKALESADRRENSALSAFHLTVAREIGLDRPIYGIKVVRDEPVKVNGVLERQDRVHVFERRPCLIDRDTPLLILDADADRELNRMVFGRRIRPAEIRAIQKLHIVQVHSTSLSNRTLLGPTPKKNPRLTGTLAKVGKVVAAEAADGSRVLVVMPMTVETALAKLGELTFSDETPFWNGAEVAYFGAIRGKDRWNGFDTVVIVGRNEPPGKAIDDCMRAICSDRPERRAFIGKGRLPRPNRGYRLSDGSLRGVRTSVHPDPMGQRLLEQIRECESTQAIGRLRSVHSEKTKRVVIICSIPLDITVDVICTLDELAGTPGRIGPLGRLKAAVDQDGILPLGARDLAKAYPDLFSSQSSAKDALRAIGKTKSGAHAEDRRDAPSEGEVPSCKYPAPYAHHLAHALLEGPHEGVVPSAGDDDRAADKENGGEHQIEILFGFRPHYRVATYRRVGQRGKSSQAIIVTERHKNPEAALSRRLGSELARFELRENPSEKEN